MNQKQIECAVTLSHMINFRRAAENLFISQPSLSYQIHSLEEEIGFEIFNRSGRSVSLTPAGAQFCRDLVRIAEELRRAVENGKNYSSRYKKSLNAALPLRSAVHFLPEIMIQFREEFPDVALNVSYVYGKERIDVLLQGDQDLVFGLESTFAHLPGVALHRIFTSRIYLVVRKDDPLASREEAVPADLRGRTLLVGGDSPPVLRKAQSLVVNSVHPSTLNSPDHMSTLTSIAAGLGVCLVPGFCNDHSGEFSWVPFSGGETFSCVWAVKKDDKRDITRRFIEMTREVYERHCACAD